MHFIIIIKTVLTLTSTSGSVQGIIKALRSIMLTASRRTCVIHYYKNFALQYPGNQQLTEFAMFFFSLVRQAVTQKAFF